MLSALVLTQTDVEDFSSQIAACIAINLNNELQAFLYTKHTHTHTHTENVCKVSFFLIKKKGQKLTT